MKSRCTYGCWYRRKCLGIMKKSMVSKLVKQIKVVYENMSENDLQALADDYSDIDFDLGHIKDNPEGYKQ